MTYEVTRPTLRSVETGKTMSAEIVPLSAGFIITAVLTVIGTEVLAAIGVGLFVYSIVWYVDSLGREIAIIPAIAVIASGQWLLGPYFAYYHDAVTYKYRMYVDETTYMSYVLPGTAALIVGMKFIAPRVHLDSIREHIQKTMVLDKKIIYYAIAIGLLFSIFGGSVRGPLAFFVFLVSQFSFIAVIYMIILRMPYRWLALAGTFGILISSSIDQSLFHTLLLWSALIASYICAELRLGFVRKLILLCLGLLLIVQLQAAKADYRDQIRLNPEKAGIAALIESMTANSIFSENESYSPVNEMGQLNARLNQGWIISSVMAYVPSSHEFENGRTIINAISDSFVPRFLLEKRAVRVSDGFRSYTGLFVNQKTSFGISILGEAWVNFGSGGIYFMAAVGAFFGMIMKVTLAATRSYPTIILWTPLLFLQAAKAETEVVVVLNHLAKTGMLIVVIYFVAHKFLKWRI